MEIYLTEIYLYINAKYILIRRHAEKYEWNCICTPSVLSLLAIWIQEDPGPRHCCGSESAWIYIILGSWIWIQIHKKVESRIRIRIKVKSKIRIRNRIKVEKSCWSIWRVQIWKKVRDPYQFEK
jgi:hypothetical protein